MNTKKIDTSEAIEKLKAKDAEPNNESARTNELLAARGGGDKADPVKASIDLNDPSLSRSAHTSHKSGFNEDLTPKDVEIPAEKAHGQTKTVSS